MNRSAAMAIVSIAASLALSCAASISRGGDYGTIKVAFGNSAVRDIATSVEGGGTTPKPAPIGTLDTGWPGGTIPTFSSVTVKVSASDMSTVTTTAPGYSGSLSVQVPAGNKRLVELTAVPAPGSTVPAFAKSYYGSATVDLSGGKTTSVAIKLSLGESKLVLPKDNYAETPDAILVADSLSVGITGTIAGFSPAGGFTFDAYGRLFMVTTANTTRLFTNLTDEPAIASPPYVTYVPNALAYDAGRNRLYSFFNSSGSDLGFTNLSDATLAIKSIAISAPYYLDTSSNGLAVDEDGYIYAVFSNSLKETIGIGKLSLDGTEETSASVVGFAPFPDIGITGATNLEVRDLIVKDGVLYIAATNLVASSYPEELYSRGKIIAVDTSTMSRVWETGWAGDDVHFPSKSNQDTQLYGPLGFVGVAPRKLYVADEGIYWGGTEGNAEGVSRVLEVDLDKQAITDIGLKGTIFVDDYQYLYVYDFNTQ